MLPSSPVVKTWRDAWIGARMLGISGTLGVVVILLVLGVKMFSSHHRTRRRKERS